MPKVIGFDETIYKKLTCRNCTAIIKYKPNEPEWNGKTDEGTKILGFYCPNCNNWLRTNP